VFFSNEQAYRAHWRLKDVKRETDLRFHVNTGGIGRNELVLDCKRNAVNVNT